MHYKNIICLILITCLILKGCSEVNKKKLGTEEISFVNVIQTDCVNPTSIQIDSAKKHQSKAIVKARVLQEEGGSKYVWTRVQIMGVLCNKTNYIFPAALRIAHYSWKGSIHENKIVILYLSPYPFGSEKLNSNNEWMLLDGDAERNVQLW